MQVTLEQIPDQEHFYAFMYGPIVLSSPTGTENMNGLYADDSRGGHIAHGKLVSLEKTPMLIGSSASLPQELRKRMMNSYHSTIPEVSTPCRKTRCD